MQEIENNIIEIRKIIAVLVKAMTYEDQQEQDNIYLPILQTLQTKTQTLQDNLNNQISTDKWQALIGQTRN
ncbi:MAG: hypothetical protein IM550_10645 [Microcystis sp. M54BS1]|uniref:hypothetical protein n=1 Tax=unclassified Microcystis TaxID=2643300 RepID=UPI00257C0442|nr:MULTISPECIES: hypothetical protein [unclassified Microcystis]MCA2539667.1 hypothetical protein [Microcystis sp. M54BS1]MCA2596220.1 hypothetical protein [Microcystis sp. M38BS1]MCA2612860.1 hypothetical protein [Microcystis sp. M27BS1]MCA2504911.1 hypothetical protein [Microcystis sp. M62BS1]MCA2513630.1 hypothetical protein [Microcystis sp. M60BS1]